MHTISDILKRTEDYLESKGVATPRLEAELLVAHALGLRRLDLYLDLKRPLSESDLALIRPGVKRRGEREPLAYIIGEKEFLARPFTVTKDVLIPRPETELLVEACYERFSKASEIDFEKVAFDSANEQEEETNTKPSESFRFADIGTGSGVIGISLACLFPAAEGFLTDISPAALEVSRGNADRNKCADRLTFLEGDLLRPLPKAAVPQGLLHLIVANLPYIDPVDEGSLEPEVAAFEPHLALFAEDRGLGLMTRLIRDAPNLLAEGGYLILEVGTGQGGALGEVADEAGFSVEEVRRDLAGHERILILQKRTKNAT